MKQKDIFLQSEGDAWYQRNVQKLDHEYNPEKDEIIQEMIRLKDQCRPSIQ